jgi:hypothetical protein
LETEDENVESDYNEVGMDDEKMVDAEGEDDDDDVEVPVEADDEEVL